MPGLLQPIIPGTLGVIITAGAAIALVNDLPAMLLSVSRLVFAWSGDGIFPAVLANVHPEKKTPYLALYLSGSFASLGILGSHFAGDFFLGIDIMVLAMLVNFLLMCLTVLTITTVNPELADKISIIRKRWLQILLALFGTITIGGFLIIHVIQDINSEVDAWYFKSTPIWLIVMAMASVIFIYKYRQNNARGMNMKDVFSRLPEQ